VRPRVLVSGPKPCGATIEPNLVKENIKGGQNIPNEYINNTYFNQVFGLNLKFPGTLEVKLLSECGGGIEASLCPDIGL